MLAVRLSGKNQGHQDTHGIGFLASLCMLKIKLPKLLPRLTRPSASDSSFELLEAVNSPPALAITSAGTEPGQALYDAPNDPDTSVVEPTESHTETHASTRVKTPTERGSYWANLIHESQERSGKIIRGKLRRVRSSKANSTRSTDGFELDGNVSSRTGVSSIAGGASITGSRPLPILDPAPQLNTPRGVRALVQNLQRSVRGGRSVPLNPGTAIRAPTVIPGTPDQDTQSEHYNIVEGHNTRRPSQDHTQSERYNLVESPDAARLEPSSPSPLEEVDTTQTETGYTYVYESVPCSQLLLILSKFVPNREYRESLLTQEIEEMVKVYVTDSTRTVEAPKRQAQAVLIPQRSVKVSASVHELPNQNQAGSSGKRSQSSAARRKRKRQRVVIEEANTDTVTESKTDKTSKGSDCETESTNDTPPTTNYPSSWNQVRPSVRPKLNLPPAPTTKPATQRSVRPLTRIPTAATKIDTPETPLPSVQPSLVRVRSSNGSAPGGLCPPPRPRRNGPLTASGKLPERSRPISMSALPRSAINKINSRPRAPRSCAPKSSQSTVEQAPDPLPAKQKRAFTQAVLEIGKSARIICEKYHRQAVAAVAGVRLDELDPVQSEADTLEQDMVGDDEESRATEAAEASGSTPDSRKRKPSARDLFGYEREVILTAKQRLLAHSLKEGALQTRGTFSSWCDEAWMDAMREVVPHLPVHPPSQSAKQIMINGLATGRGRFKEPIRSLVELTLGFLKPARTQSDVNHNLALFKKLHPNTFHCSNFDPPKGFYEGDLLVRVIASTMFANPNSIGVVYCEYFEPIPLETAAFLLSVAQHCVEEFETGQYQQRNLSMTDMLNKYVAHLQGLKAACRKAKIRMGRLRQAWFDFGFEYSGAVRPEKKFYQPVTLESDIRSDTPEPTNNEELDVEMYDEYETNEAGDYTTRAKGKWRAANPN